MADLTPISIRVKLCAECGFRDEATRLTEDGMERPSVDFVMVGDGQGLVPILVQCATHFNVTASLREDLKPEFLEDPQYVAT